MAEDGQVVMGWHCPQELTSAWAEPGQGDPYMGGTRMCLHRDPLMASWALDGCWSSSSGHSDLQKLLGGCPGLLEDAMFPS